MAQNVNEKISEDKIDECVKSHSKKKLYLEITKINEYIYLGCCTHPLTNSEEFQKLGIDVLINCAAEVKYPADTNYHVENFRIIDGEGVSFLENMDQAANKIRFHYSNGKKIYLTCARGISRSPAILIYFLMSHKKCTYDTAHSLVRKKRRIISVNEEFESSMRAIED
jgi:protein-tyrosine phosphatase